MTLPSLPAKRCAHAEPITAANCPRSGPTQTNPGGKLRQLATLERENQLVSASQGRSVCCALLQQLKP